MTLGAPKEAVMGNLAKLEAATIEVPDDLDGLNELYYERGWTDGLPVIPPTEHRVSRMLDGTLREPNEVLGVFPPAGNETTVGHIAINAVMAGCLPDYMPVLLAVVEALLEEKFNLQWIQATTHPVAPLVIVNGPVRERLGMNWGSGLFGPCNRANATIGRAVRLMLLNLGGAKPGALDLSTHGQPSKYSFCIAENEALNPWEPLHVERGFMRSSNTVTVCGMENPHNINDHKAENGVDLLTTIVGTIATQGNNNILYQSGEALLAISPEHASILAGSGYSKQRVKEYLYEKARLPKSSFSKPHQREQFGRYGDNDSVPLVQQPEDFIIVVTGGPGRHSMYCPSFAMYTRSVTKGITE
jgi:hypothetical protein